MNQKYRSWNLMLDSQESTPDKDERPAGTPFVFEREKLTVERVDNHVYFYADVNTDRCLALIRTIRNLDQELRNERISRMLPSDVPGTPIWLHIQSGGGSLFTGFNIGDQLRTIHTPIYSIVEGYCASAATLISCACTKRFILPTSFMLIHELWSIAWGSYTMIQDEMHLLDLAMEKLIGFYKSYTKMTVPQIKGYLRRDSWFTAPESIEAGLVDEVLKIG